MWDRILLPKLILEGKSILYKKFENDAFHLSFFDLLTIDLKYLTNLIAKIENDAVHLSFFDLLMIDLNI